MGPVQDTEDEGIGMSHRRVWDLLFVEEVRHDSPLKTPFLWVGERESIGCLDYPKVLDFSPTLQSLLWPIPGLHERRKLALPVPKFPVKESLSF